MKKRLLLIPLMSLMFGGIVGLTTKKITEVKAEEIAEVIEEETDNSKIDNLVEELQKVKDMQFMNSLLGALTGGIGSMLVSCLFMFINKDIQAKLKRDVKQGTVQLGASVSVANDLNKKYLENNEKIALVIDEVGKANEYAKDFIARAEQIEINQEELAKKHKEEVDMLLAIISSSKDLVANGTAEKLNKIYKK